MEEQLTPENQPVIEARLDKLLTGIRMGWLKVTSLFNLLLGFLTHVAMIPQLREKKQIENMASYLDAVSQVLDELEKRGATKTEIKKMAQELNVPIIESNLKAMLLLRELPYKYVVTDDVDSDRQLQEPADEEG
ncbi:hypothetical protein P4B35_23580 [Pontiellaceae bacterium B12227]|nr:hypothetical protein [Pontiellaceae bacterium B12227]